VKFTPKGGKVSIVTRNEEGGRLVIEVSDTGIGISAAALSRIFSPFEQGNSSIYRRYGGLDLSIANTLIKAHGGTLEAASQGLDKGAKFTARFKIDDSATDLTAQDPLQRKSTPPPGTTNVASINSTNPKL
jgi:signal transduction histidine kinase